jgi:hypothetical protein
MGIFGLLSGLVFWLSTIWQSAFGLHSMIL